MKVSIDGQLFLKGEKTGIGWVAHNILSNLNMNCNKKYQLNCFVMGYDRGRQQEIDKYKKSGYSIKKVKWFHDVIYRMIWNFIPIPYWFFFERNSQVTIFFNYIIPPGVRGKKIAMVHDMSYKAYPETVRAKTRKFLELSLAKTCKRADKIITISEFSKAEIIRYLQVESEKIEVISLGVDTKYYNSDYSERDIEKIKEKYNINSEYFLYLGTIEPRKNIERLIRAYGALYEQKKDIPKLILAGKKGWLYDEIFNTVDELKLHSMIEFLGYVDIKDAPKLIKGAIAFVFPSLYEGFGLPPLEAMACGTPVITSNVASLPEVVGEAGLLVNPLDINEIKDAMLRIETESGLRTQLVEAGLLQAKKFNWEKTAKCVEEILDRYE
ncbi:glycosyltransferase family 4 protein [Anaerosporobacter sp.]|uniref:glycosyltransferase family 4 protein n=1 Tax=Anaerosporobacter sp. TaxID=1872529 RepID=UPI00286F34B9|nr:glycosyltransferase family 1 protein [Anaerosporobacter sp.]